MLGVKQQVAYEWVHRGLLRTFKGPGKDERGARVTTEAVEAFQKEFATGVELAASVNSRSRRYSSEHVMQLGLEPVSGPTVDGARQFLFRRADADRAKLRPLKQFVRGEKASRGIGEVQWLVIVIGRALPQCLGHAFTQTSSRFVSKDGRTTVQVVTGRRKGFSGRFAFVVSATQIRRLEDATDGYLALGFVGQEHFLLIPWKEASSLLRLRSTGDGADVYLDPDALGSSHALGVFAVPLA